MYGLELQTPGHRYGPKWWSRAIGNTWSRFIKALSGCLFVYLMVCFEFWPAISANWKAAQHTWMLLKKTRDDGFLIYAVHSNNLCHCYKTETSKLQSTWSRELQSVKWTNTTLNPLTCDIRFPSRLSGPSWPHRLPFLPLLAACSLIFLFPVLRPCNLSLLFYLPEGECFWITGLINKVNTDGPPLTQRSADRGTEKQLGTEGRLSTHHGSGSSQTEADNRARRSKIFWDSSKMEILERTVTDVRRLLVLSSKGHVCDICAQACCILQLDRN